MIATLQDHELRVVILPNHLNPCASAIDTLTKTFFKLRPQHDVAKHMSASNILLQPQNSCPTVTILMLHIQHNWHLQQSQFSQSLNCISHLSCRHYIMIPKLFFLLPIHIKLSISNTIDWWQLLKPKSQFF